MVHHMTLYNVKQSGRKRKEKAPRTRRQICPPEVAGLLYGRIVPKKNYQRNAHPVAQRHKHLRDSKGLWFEGEMEGKRERKRETEREIYKRIERMRRGTIQGARDWCERTNGSKG